MKKITLKLFVLINLCFTANAVQAHHAFAAEFDKKLEGSVEGVVSRVLWSNPHVRYAISVKNPDGKIENWMLQPPGNINSYRREGWYKDSIKVGDKVTASGNLGRNGAKKLYATCIELDSGLRFGICEHAISIKKTTADVSLKYGYQGVQREVNISGLWDNRYKFEYTVNDLKPKPVPASEKALEIRSGRQFGDDPALRCIGPGLPRIFGSHAAWEIVDAGTHYIVITQQNNISRWIWMTDREKPQGYDLTTMGFSKGRWEGRTLVIETVDLLPGWLDGSGYPMTGGDGTRIVEKWTVAEDGLTMDREMTIYDDYYAQPLIRNRGSQRTDQTQMETPNCDPNNHYRDLRDKGLLDSRLDG